MPKVLNKEDAPPTKPTIKSITLKLNKEEAEVVMWLVGKTLGDDKYAKAAGDIYDTLDREGVNGEPGVGAVFDINNKKIVGIKFKI